MNQPVHDEIIKILEELARSPISAENNQELEKDLGIDSLGVAQVAAALEEQGIPVADLSAIKTVGDVLALIESRPQLTEREPSGWAIRLCSTNGVKLEDVFNLEWSAWERALTGGARVLFNIAFSAVHRLEIHGLDTLPLDRPFLLCPNHQSYPDPLFLYARLPRQQLERMLFVGWGGYFRRPPFSWINRIGRVLPTGGPGRLPECLRLAYEGLQMGMSVCIFPEGGRTTADGLMKPRPGAGILAHEAGVPIYPVRLDGALGSLSWQRTGIHFCKIRMRVLDPIYPERNGEGTMADYQRLMQQWRSAIEESPS